MFLSNTYEASLVKGIEPMRFAHSSFPNGYADGSSEIKDNVFILCELQTPKPSKPTKRTNEAIVLDPHKRLIDKILYFHRQNIVDMNNARANLYGVFNDNS